MRCMQGTGRRPENVYLIGGTASLATQRYFGGKLGSLQTPDRGRWKLFVEFGYWGRGKGKLAACPSSRVGFAGDFGAPVTFGLDLAVKEFDEGFCHGGIEIGSRARNNFGQRCFRLY